MKNVKFLLSLMLAIVFFSCSKTDSCEGVSCQNGGNCTDGKCLCPNGFEGTLCQTETLPKAVNVTSIKVTKLPLLKTDGSAWDNDGTNPEIFPALFTLKTDNTIDQSLWVSDIIKLSAPLNQQHEFSIILPKLSMTNFDKTLGFFIFDKDDANQESMGGISFALKEFVKGRPEKISLDCATCKVGFELSVTYE